MTEPTVAELREALGDLAEAAALAAHYLLQKTSTDSGPADSARIVLWILADIGPLISATFRPPCVTCGTTDPMTSPTHHTHLRAEKPQPTHPFQAEGDAYCWFNCSDEDGAQHFCLLFEDHPVHA